MSVTVLHAPETKRITAKAAKYLKKRKHDGLFLPFPKESTEFIVQFLEGISYPYLMSQIKKELDPILAPIGPWEQIFEPLLKSLSQIKAKNPKLQPFCYGDSSYAQFNTENSSEIAALTLKVSLSKKVNIEEWVNIIQKDWRYREDALQREIDFVILNATKQERNVCISSKGQYFVSKLQEEGYKTTLISIGQYSPTPIERLQKEVAQGNISEKVIREFVLLHIQYVKNYVLTSANLEEAKYRWQIRKSFWKRLLFAIKKLSKTT